MEGHAFKKDWVHDKVFTLKGVHSFGKGGFTKRGVDVNPLNYSGYGPAAEYWRQRALCDTPVEAPNCAHAV